MVLERLKVGYLGLGSAGIIPGQEITFVHWPNVPSKVPEEKVLGGLLTPLWAPDEMRDEQRTCFEVTCQHLTAGFDLTFVSRSDNPSIHAPGSGAGPKSEQRWLWLSAGIFGMLLI